MEFDIEDINENTCPLCKRTYCLGYGLISSDNVRKVTCVECGRTFEEHLKIDKVVLVE